MERGGKYYYNRNRWVVVVLVLLVVVVMVMVVVAVVVVVVIVAMVARSTLVAFTVGELYQPGGEFKVGWSGRRRRGRVELGKWRRAIHGMQVIGAHTDSPVLKVKPVSARTAHGYLQVGGRHGGGDQETLVQPGRRAATEQRLKCKEGAHGHQRMSRAQKSDEKLMWGLKGAEEKQLSE